MKTPHFAPRMALLATLLTLVVGCSKTTGIGGAAGDASPETLKANAQFAQELKLDDAQDFEDAKRGFIAKPTGQIKAADGTVLKDFEVYAFLDGKAPDTVNPSLWRHAQLNAQIGLFKVTDGVYQLRGFDIANMTLIEGKTGWIVVDPLTARETSAAALALHRNAGTRRALKPSVGAWRDETALNGFIVATSISTIGWVRVIRRIVVICRSSIACSSVANTINASRSLIRRAYSSSASILR